MIWSKGGIYKGHFVNGKCEGYGIETKKDGKIYEGNFKNDLYEGKGIKKYPNEERYKVDFHEGFFEGNGIWYYWDNSKLEGISKKGKKDGKAKKTMEMEIFMR